MGTEAAVVVLPQEPGPMTIETLELPDPVGHQVLVKEYASGICHSQLHQIHSQRSTPVVLGHEATGQVLAVGPEVTHVVPGDDVLLTFQPRDLRNTDRKPEVAGVDLGDGGGWAVSPQIFTWATHTIADDQYVIPMAAGTPTDVTSIVGCAVLTGAGAVLRSGEVTEGQSVAVWGVGGVGLNAVAAASIIGANPVIAVDLDDEKLALAQEFGATHLINAATTDPIEAVRALTPGPPGAYGFRGSPIAGVDVAFDVVANQQSFGQAFRSTRTSRSTIQPGGTTVIVGVPQANLELPAIEMLVNERQVKGTLGGTSIPGEDIPMFLDWYLKGQLDLDALVTSRVGIDEINEATKMLEEGKVLGRSIIEL